MLLIKTKTFLLIFLIFISNQLYAMTSQTFTYQHNKETYAYQIKETGINYNFRFEKSPGDLAQKKQAGLHVLRSIYMDDSIVEDFSKAYKKERANCYALEARFYTYTLCFLPNDFAPEKQERFWGFTTRVPNWLWQITHVLMPLLLVFGVIFYFTSNRK